MPFLAASSSVDLTAGADSTLTIQNPGGYARVELPIGTKLWEGGQADAKINIPGGACRLTTVTGGAFYELTVDARAGTLSAAEVAATQALVSGDGDWQANTDIRQWTPRRSVLEDFSVFTDWTVTNSANGFITAAPPKVNYPYSGGIRFLSDGGGTNSPNCWKNLAANGISDGLILNSVAGFWLVTDILQPAAGGKSLNLNVAFFETAGGFGSNGFQLAVAGPALSLSTQARWVPKSEFAAIGAGAWTNAMRSLRVRHDGGAGTVRDVVLAGMFTQGKRPTVIFQFDDGWTESFSSGHAEAQRRGIPLTHYVIPSLLGSANYITSAQAAQMRAAGDYLGVHGANRWDLGVSRVASDIAACRAAGIDTQHASIPEGQHGDAATWAAIRSALVDNGVKTARMTAAAGSPHHACMLHGVGDPYALSSYGPNNLDGTALATSKAAIDAAIASGGTVIFYLHRIGATADSLFWNLNDYRNLLDYAYQKRIEGALDITTVDRWYSGAH